MYLYMYGIQLFMKIVHAVKAGDTRLASYSFVPLWLALSRLLFKFYQHNKLERGREWVCYYIHASTLYQITISFLVKFFSSFCSHLCSYPMQALPVGTAFSVCLVFIVIVILGLVSVWF